MWGRHPAGTLVQTGAANQRSTSRTTRAYSAKQGSPDQQATAPRSGVSAHMPTRLYPFVASAPGERYVVASTFAFIPAAEVEVDDEGSTSRCRRSAISCAVAQDDEASCPWAPSTSGDRMRRLAGPRKVIVPVLGLGQYSRPTGAALAVDGGAPAPDSTLDTQRP
jgi:hypothetical protein